MEYYDLGTHSWPVTTSAPEAQAWFDRGLVWATASTTRRRCAASSRRSAPTPTVRMAYWGIAYALGPNYNKHWEAFDEDDLRTSPPRRRRHLPGRAARRGRATPAERALIGALRARYAPDEPPGELGGLERELRRGDGPGVRGVPRTTRTWPRCTRTR